MGEEISAQNAVQKRRLFAMSNIQENRKVLEEQEGRIIRQTIADMESAFNQHDADALDCHFTQDSTWVNVMGRCSQAGIK